MIVLQANANAAQALLTANNAETTANSAFTVATSAHGVANTALANVAIAQTTANTAVANAAAAQTTADGALQRTGGTMTGNIDMGGNAIWNVAGPINAGDAANKGYVDAQIGFANAAIGGLRSDVNRAFQEIDQNTQGIAVAIAMGGLVLPDAKNFAVAANVGFYDDKQAFAAQAAVRLDRTFTLNGGVGVGMNDFSKVGGRAGVMASW